MCTMSELAICTSEEGGGPCEVQLRDDQKVWLGKVYPQLFVQLRYNVYTKFSYIQSASIGSEVRLRVMKSRPEGVTIHWSKEDGETLKFKSRSLHIQSVTDSHFGVYKVEMKREGETLLTIYRHLYQNG